MPSSSPHWDYWFAWLPVRLAESPRSFNRPWAFLRTVERFRCYDAHREVTRYYPKGYHQALPTPSEASIRQGVEEAKNNPAESETPDAN